MTKLVIDTLADAGLTKSPCWTRGTWVARSQPSRPAGNGLSACYNIVRVRLDPSVATRDAINSWNGPFGSSEWKIAPALAAGSTVVLKPAEQPPLPPPGLGELCVEAGIFPGVVNVGSGPGNTVGTAQPADPGVNKVAFTGSTATGQAIIRAFAGNMKRLSLELGGKFRDIDFGDADIHAAVRRSRDNCVSATADDRPITTLSRDSDSTGRDYHRVG